MKRLIAGLTVTVAIAMLAGAGMAWNRYLRVPPVERAPLPAQLIALDSAEGQALLAQSQAVADYPELQKNFVAQSRKAYCGVASALVVLNAAGVTQTPLDQDGIFSHPSVGIDPLKVSFIGMSLREFGELLRAHGVRTTVVYASDTDVAAFRKLMRANLSEPGDFLLLNYQRERLGQERSGHISPVAAYHEASDRLLILDVAAHKYPPVWVKVDAVWDAMNDPLNEETAITRGFVVIDTKPGIAAR